jgi:hypothetical protein
LRRGRFQEAAPFRRAKGVKEARAARILAGWRGAAQARRAGAAGAPFTPPAAAPRRFSKGGGPLAAVALRLAAYSP